MSDPARIVSCPTCDKRVKWTTANPHRPFCSARCKLIDLGSWADESNRIPGDADHQGVNSGDLD
jgi:endogenous inhibitor of DNA gyrase (YacG/DUF329 family)